MGSPKYFHCQWTKKGWYQSRPQAELDVNGRIMATNMHIRNTPTTKFVFANDYAMHALKETEKFIKENKHLPEILSAKDMEKDGVDVGVFQIQLLQKIEELTLYSIEQNKKIEEQAKDIEMLKQQLPISKTKD